MKKLLILLIVFTFSCSRDVYQPFCGTSKHKTVKKMSKRQVKNAKKGKTMYKYKNGKIKKR